MYRSAQRRSSTTRGRSMQAMSGRKKRIIFALGTLTVFAGIVAVTQVSSAHEQLRNASGGAQTVQCPSVQGRLPAVPAAAQAEVTRNLALLDTQISEANNRLSRTADQGSDFANNAILSPLESKRTATLERIEIAIGRVAARPTGLRSLASCTLGGGAPAENAPQDPGAAEEEEEEEEEEPPPLEVLANNCDNSELEPHDGFQLPSRCVSTAMGEVGAAPDNPTLLITDAPENVDVDEPFTIQVSTRNLVRDRFLAAGQGGYYLESSLLDDEGLVRGHFHTACRMLGSTDEAPDPEPVPDFFVATEDGGGGTDPDVVSIEVAGLPEAGVAQCSAWAGDGSHRLPMMERANQTPAFDSVRVVVND